MQLFYGTLITFYNVVMSILWQLTLNSATTNKKNIILLLIQLDTWRFYLH